MLGVLQYKQVDPTKIYYDSKSAIELSKNPVLHGHNNHIDLKHQFIHKLVREKSLQLIIVELKSKWLTFSPKH